MLRSQSNFLLKTSILLFFSFLPFFITAQVDYFRVFGGWQGNDANGNAVIKLSLIHI